MRLVPLVMVLLLCASGLLYAQDSDNTLIVEVVNSAGQPIKYACVTVVPRSGDIVFQKADKHGRVKVKRLHRGNYRVVVKVEGYKAQKKEVIVVGAEDTVAFILDPRDER